jgi:branched-chain amino acid transport system substrate-binding protein
MEIANGPADGGHQDPAGELGKALELIAAGTAIDYDGATGVDADRTGESAGRFAEDEIKGGKWETVGYPLRR